MGQRGFIKLFFVILFSTLFLISFSHYGASAFDKMIFEEERFSTGTKIGEIDISGLTREEAEKLVEKKVSEWITSPPIKLICSEIVMQIPGDIFELQVEQSMKQTTDGQTSGIIADVNREQLLSFIKEHIPSNWADETNIEQLSNDLAQIASSLQTAPATVNMIDYINNGVKPLFTDQIIGEVTVEKLDADYFSLLRWLSKHPVLEIEGNRLFSVRKYFQGAEGEISPQSASILASAIYKVVLATNFEIVERHISRELPPGIEPGFEAKLDYKRHDFLFYNPNFYNYQLQFRVTNHGFTVVLKGVPFIQKYVFERDEMEYYEPKTVIHYSNDVQADKREIKQEGKQGLLARVKRKTFDLNGQLIETKVISEDFYFPIHKIEVHPLLPGKNERADETVEQVDEPLPSEDVIDEENGSGNVEDGEEETTKEAAGEQTDVYEK